MPRKPGRSAKHDRWEEIRASQSIFRAYPRSFWIRVVALGLASFLVLSAVLFLLYLLQRAWWAKVIP